MYFSRVLLCYLLLEQRDNRITYHLIKIITLLSSTEMLQYSLCEIMAVQYEARQQIP